MINWKLIAPTVFIMDNNNKWVRNWFSNMVISPIIIDGVEWASVENYYQGMKEINPVDRIMYTLLSPSDAKASGRKANLRPEWEEIKESVMKQALKVKFAPGTNHAQRLLETEDAILVEWNNWGDKYWGVCIKTYKGLNRLGVLLMEVRTELRR